MGWPGLRRLCSSVDAQVAQTSRPRAVERLPVRPVTRVTRGIVRSLALSTRKDVAEVGLDLGLFRGALWFDYEIGAPLPSLSSAVATVDQVFVEGDHVARLRVDCLARAGQIPLEAGRERN